MPGYIAKALKVFQHVARNEQHQPFPSVPIKYGAKKQYATQDSTAPLLDAAVKNSSHKFLENFISWMRRGRYNIMPN